MPNLRQALQVFRVSLPHTRQVMSDFSSGASRRADPLGESLSASLDWASLMSMSLGFVSLALDLASLGSVSLDLLCSGSRMAEVRAKQERRDERGCLIAHGTAKL